MVAKQKPSLPVDDFEFSPATVEWFNTWRDNPITDSWDERHWQYMFDTAIVHSLVYSSFNFSVLGELDKRERYMGLTFPQNLNEPTTKKEVTVLQFVQEDRAKRHARATNS